MKRSEIAKQVADLLAKHRVTTPPVQVEQIALTEGIKVVRSAAEWSESGFLLRVDHSTIIGINSRNARRRQRFTIAHELGHWLLHKGKPLIVDQSVMVNKRDEISSQATEPEEMDANYFAAELLMPQSFTLEAIARHMKAGIGSRDELVTALAKDFDVSADAMGYRLINLGVLSG